MAEKDVKATRHNVTVCLLAEKPITYASATFQLAKSIDAGNLEDNGLIVMGYEISSSLQPDPNIKNNQLQRNGNKKRIIDAAEGSLGALGKITAKLKQYTWKQLYIGFGAGVLLSILLVKWVGRILTGTFF